MKKIYIPSNLDLTKLFPGQTIEELDKFHYFLHLMYEQKILYRNSKEYINLKSEYLRAIIVRDYNYYRDLLIKHNIIECDWRYIQGEKSMGYRLLPPYSEVKHKQIFLKNKKIIKNIEKWKSKRLPTTEVHKHLYYFLNKIEINSEKARESIINFNNSNYNFSEIAIQKLIDKDFYLISDDYGRVHTNITTLKACLRKYITYKGEKLFNVDIENSQPLILLLIPILSNTIRCTFGNEGLDIFKYKSLVEQGKFYEYLIDNMDYDDYLADQSKEYDRGQFKENFFRETLFGRKISSTFWDLFPSIAKIIADLKKNDYRRVAWMMQRAESDLIINKVCRRIMIEDKDCFVSTIHDSILTTEANVHKVKKVMVEEFKKLGLSPSIRIDQT